MFRRQLFVPRRSFFVVVVVVAWAFFFGAFAFAATVDFSECPGGDDETWAGRLGPKDVGAVLWESPVCAKALLEAKLLEAAAAAALVTEARLALRMEAPSFTKKTAVKELQRVVPAVEWAQSSEKVFLRVKWAHKIDAPATLDVATPTVRCDGTTVTVAAEAETKRFDLRLALVHPVSSCDWEAGAVGRITVTADKLHKDMWPQLTNDTKGVHFWFDKQDQLKEGDDDDDDATARTERPDRRVFAAQQSKEKNTTTKNNETTPPKAPKKAEVFWWLLDEREAAGHFFADLRAAVANFFDGWTGDPKDFVARQGDRALARARRNTTRHVARLKREATEKKRKITAEVNANVSKLEKDLLLLRTTTSSARTDDL